MMMKTSPLSFYVSRCVSLSFRKLAMVCSVAICATAIGLSGCRVQTPVEPAADENVASDVDAATIGTVTVEIASVSDDAEAGESDAGEPLLNNTIEISEGSTVESVMKKVESPEVVISGNGITAFVQSIDGVETDATRGWTYTVDGEFATEGIGSTELKAGQTVRWRFTTLEEAMATEKAVETEE
ncbi:hypothetical protein FHS27_000359 [Rhodopirellula rubra]|uniref:Transcobalamin-like C-terminal domain-containing protein n=1 Tax=Aporhodopirellula rubra TaxID=980271 RepID=A0A7W5H450_9BACT|nr:DUF4430 domain-containing protein [Aporhodopirellula rubra]MBB3204595.1 hypothetical protein [Aporhodopirellula rubra]